MILKIKDTDIEYLKTLCRCFNNFTAYVHEKVYITVGYEGGAEDHEACEALNEFRDQCIYPEFFEMINDIQGQLKDTIPDPKDLKEMLDRVVNDWFYMKQEDRCITDGAEPFDSRIKELEKELANECERVLGWQTSDPCEKFFRTFDNAKCTCSGNPVTSYKMEQHSGDAPVEGFFEAWDSMVRAIKDSDRVAVLNLGYKLHSLINLMDTSIYDYKHGTWIDDYINWYLEEVEQ